MLELGKIDIIPNYLLYADVIEPFATVGFAGLTIVNEDKFYTANPFNNVLNYSKSIKAKFDTDTDAQTMWSWGFPSVGGDSIDNIFVCIIDGHNFYTAKAELNFLNDSLNRYDGSPSGEVVALTNNLTITSDTVYPDDDNFFAYRFKESQVCQGMSIYPSQNNSDEYDADLEVGIVHMGLKYTTPSNAYNSLSYSKVGYNRTSRTKSGVFNSYQTNTKTKRIIKSTWTGFKHTDNSMSSVDTYADMIEQCMGSHVPVAIQLKTWDQRTQTGTYSDTDIIGQLTSEHFIFMRVTGFNMTQNSPNTWTATAEFTEIDTE